MNKALILNGGGTSHPYAELADRAASWARGHGYEPAVFDLTNMAIKPCRGCFGCWIKSPGLCAARDDMDKILPVQAGSDLYVLVTPVSYGGYGYHLKKWFDRSIPILLPFFEKVQGELHHPLRYGMRSHRLAGIGVEPRVDAENERIFQEIVRRNSINLRARFAAVVLGENDAFPAERLEALFREEEN